MHELSLVLSLLEICEEEARLQGFDRIGKVVIEAGELSGVSVSALRFCFDVAAKGTPAEGAELEVLEPPGIGWCFSCDRTVCLRDPFRECPACGRSGIMPSGGMEFRLRELVVHQGEPERRDNVR